MENQFKLEVFTPARKFFDGQVEEITFDGEDGQFGVLAGHTPMVSNLHIGEFRIKLDGKWKSAFISEGFVDVRPDEVLVFTQACEWPEEIDEARALSAKARAIAQLNHKQSVYEHNHSVISLTRAMQRLKLKGKL